MPEVSLNVPEFAKEQEEGPLSIDLVQNDQNDDIKAFLMKALNKDEDADNTKDSSVVMSKIETPQVEKPEVSETLSKDGEKNFSSEINKVNVSLKELIENAKQKLADNYEQINKEDEAEQRKEAEERINKEAENIDMCHKSEEPIYVTKNGYGDMVIMSMENYENTMNRIAMYHDIEISEQQIRKGQVRDARISLQETRGKYGL